MIDEEDDDVTAKPQANLLKHQSQAQYETSKANNQPSTSIVSGTIDATAMETKVNTIQTI